MRVNAVAPSPPPAEGRHGTAYAEVTVPYVDCPLVRMSGGLGASRLECCGSGDDARGAHFVKFIVRKEGHAAGPEDVERYPGVDHRYEGDVFHAYRLYTPPCGACFFPTIARRGFVPLKAVATRGELHLATLVESFDAFKGLLADFRARGAEPHVTLLTHGATAHSEVRGRHPSLDDLTPRQREVIESAYRAGYFHGKDLDVERLSKDLGISVSTYYSHLRLASHKVLQHVLSRTEP